MIATTTNFDNARTAFSNGRLRYFIEIAGYSRAFTNFNDGVVGHYNWLTETPIDNLDVTINDLDGGADQSTLSFYVQDRGGAITSDFPGFVFEGAAVTLKIGFDGLSYADYATIFTGYIDTVCSANHNLEYQFNCSDVSGRLSEVIYQTSDDGQPTSSEHTKTLTGHPLDILLDILLVKIGLNASFVDSTKIEAYRDGPFAGMEFLFHLDQAPAAADFIKSQLLKPLGGYMWVGGSGKISVNFFYPLAGPVAVGSLGPHVWTEVPEAEQTDMVNTVQFKFDKDDQGGSSGDFMAQDTEQFTASVTRYGLFGEQVIEASGLRSGFQGFFIAKIVSRMIFMRYGFKNLKFDSNAVPGFWLTVVHEPGDIMSVTHPLIPDRLAGVMGVTAKLFEVLGKSIDFAAGLVTLTMIDASYLTSNFGFYKIAPDAEADYVSASTADKAKYMFQCGDDDKYSNGDAAHILG